MCVSSIIPSLRLERLMVNPIFTALHLSTTLEGAVFHGSSSRCALPKPYVYIRMDGSREGTLAVRVIYQLWFNGLPVTTSMYRLVPSVIGQRATLIPNQNVMCPQTIRLRSTSPTVGRPEIAY